MAGTDASGKERKASAATEMGTADVGGVAERPRHRARRGSEVDEEGHLAGKGVGWPDGVGDGQPFEVPMTVDYFQGFLVQAGVPGTAVPKDGRTLSPQQALELVRKHPVQPRVSATKERDKVDARWTARRQAYRC